MLQALMAAGPALAAAGKAAGGSGLLASLGPALGSLGGLSGFAKEEPGHVASSGDLRASTYNVMNNPFALNSGEAGRADATGNPRVTAPDERGWTAQASPVAAPRLTQAGLDPVLLLAVAVMVGAALLLRRAG